MIWCEGKLNFSIMEQVTFQGSIEKSDNGRFNQMCSPRKITVSLCILNCDAGFLDQSLILNGHTYPRLYLWFFQDLVHMGNLSWCTNPKVEGVRTLNQGTRKMWLWPYFLDLIMKGLANLLWICVCNWSGFVKITLINSHGS